jgi:hypothetical protein
MTSVEVLETLTLTCPLGLRFWDPVDRAPVSEGLSVAIWPTAFPDLVIPAIPNRTDVFTFHDLPGMRAIENGAGDDAFWAANPPRFDFVVQVQDTLNRFLSFQLALRLPMRGLSDLHPLFSSPGRTLVSPMGIIRAQFLDAVHHAPAAWALVEARVGGALVGRGVADAQGNLLLPLPYPEALNAGPAFGSPLGASGVKLADQTWPVALSFYYGPQHPQPAIPDLDQVFNQPPATAWVDEMLSAPLTAATLRFGQDLVLRSRAVLASPPASRWLSTLLITAAGSPP